jgi:hypothetical protein
MRTREPDQGRGVHQPHWRETKNAAFHRMQSNPVRHYCCSGCGWREGAGRCQRRNDGKGMAEQRAARRSGRCPRSNKRCRGSNADRRTETFRLAGLVTWPNGPAVRPPPPSR